jgi:uncharacterized short protein YbdD (DUF466 family)
MRTIFGAKGATLSSRAGSADPVTDASGQRLSAVTRTVRRAYLQLFGIPDYERYAEHMASHHPDEPQPSRREFCARAIDRKYGHIGPRCC